MIKSITCSEFGVIYRKIVQFKMRNIKHHFRELKKEKEYCRELRKSEKIFLKEMRSSKSLKTYDVHSSNEWCDWINEQFNLILNQVDAEIYEEQVKKTRSLYSDFVSFIKSYDELINGLAALMIFSINNYECFKKRVHRDTIEQFSLKLPQKDYVPKMCDNWDQDVYDKLVKFIHTKEFKENDDQSWFHIL